jgi:hypothetical protein
MSGFSLLTTVTISWPSNLLEISVYLGSFSADQPLSFEFSQNIMGSDDLQPCIEDIRLEIDRLRREEQLLRERFVL